MKLLVMCILLLSSCSCLAEQDTWLQRFAKQTQDRAKQNNLPGYTFVFVEKNQPAKVVTFGRTESNGAIIDQSTVFRLASVSKTFTGVLMAKSVAQKQFDWSTPILELAPKYGFDSPQLKQINLRHLMSQSSGYTPNAYDNLIEANYSLQRVLAQLAKLKPLCEPGNCYTYQNALFGVLEDYYINRNSSYATALKQQIIEPLNMPYASIGRQSLQNSPKWAKPHIAITRSKWRKGHVQDDYYRFSPAAGVNASIEDMAIWIRAMLGEYPQVISQEIIDTVTTPLVKTSKELRRRDWRQSLRDAHYGLGWRVYDFAGHKLNYHGGWVQGYRADVAIAPDDGVGYAMLMNAESNLINSFTAEFWKAYFTQQDQKPLPRKALALKAQ